jgi:hypothetical protein
MKGKLETMSYLEEKEKSNVGNRLRALSGKENTETPKKTKTK